MNFLQCLWSGVETKRAIGSGPGCLHQELPAAQRLIRDLPAGELTKIVVDDKHILDQLKKFCDDIQIDLPNGLNYYSESQPLFGKYGIDHEIG